MLLFAFLVFVTGIASSLGDYDGSAFPLGEGPRVVPSKTDLKAERAFRAQLAAVPGKSRIPHTVQALEYNVTIHPYFPAPGVSYPGEKNFTFDGHLRFHFKALQRLDFIQLDAQNIDLDYINIFDSNGAKMRVTYVTYHAKFMRFSVAPLVGFDANQEYVVEMIYRGKINHYRNAGLFYTSFIDANKTLHYIVATHMESGYGAKSVFPCIDDPSFKAHFLLTLNYPAHPSFVPLANTLEHEGSILGKGYKKVEFPRTLLMSTYLVAFATGEFVAKSARTPDGILVRSWAWIGMEDYLEFAANTSAQCLYKMSQYVNFTFPMDKTDQLGLPEFPAGAMENYGLIIYKYQYIAYNPKVHTTFNKFSAIRVMCHELSHQWFGDTVTAMWWDDLFLHEGFAGYYEYYLPEMTFPSQSPFLSSDFVAANEETGLLADADLRYSHPVIYKDGPAFDDMTYNKGGSVLRMLRQVIGDTAFQNGLQSYIAKYKFQNANHSMLFNELTSAAADQGILDWCNRLIDVNHFMDPWMLQQNFPLISVTHNGDYETLTQASFSDPSKLPPSPYNYSWPVPVFYQGDPQVKHLQLAWIIPSYENNCPDPAIEPKYRAGKFQLNNADSWTFARVKYDDDSFQAILKALKSDNSISVASKVRLLNDAKTFAMQESKLGNSDAYIRVLDLINAILPSSDPHLAIFATVQEFIDLLEGLMNSNNQRALYGQFVKATIGPLCNQVGWNTSNSWDLNIARERILPYCVRYNLPGFVKTAMSLYNDLLGACSKFRNGTESCNPLHPDIRKAVYCAAAMQNNQNIFTQLISFYVAQYENDIYFYQAYQALLHGLSCAPNEMNLTAVVHHIVNSPLVGSTELFYMATNPLVFQTFRDYIQNPDNFNKIVQRGLLRGYLNAMTFNVFDSIRSGQLVDLSNKYLNVMNGDQRKIFYEFVLKTNEQVRFSKKHEKSIERWMWNNVVIIAPAFPPWPKRLPANAAYPTAYSIKIKPYLPGSPGMKPDQNLTFEATSTMNFVMLQTTNELTINAHRMIFSEITLQDFDTGSLLPVDLSKIVYDFDNAIITLVLPIVLKPNVDQLIIFKYTGFIFGKPHGGISVNTFVNTLDHDKLSWIFFTDYEGGPEFRSMAPSFDEPNYKATWQITIVHPKDTVALSNMPAKSSLMPLPSESLWTETQFEKTKKMSTYLVEMIVGHFASIQAVSKSGVTVRVFAWPGMEVKGEYALRAAIGTLDFMGTYFESNFPLPKLDVIALPQYIPGADAMENWGLITNEFDMVLFDKDYGTVEQLMSVLQVTSHEVVHQWFGDLVTLEWWDYVFLNEGFAEYWWMQCLISTFPEQADVFKFIRFDNHQSGMKVDQDPSSWGTVIVNTTTLTFDPFGSETYKKGSSLLEHMRSILGDETLRKGLVSYLKKHAYGSVTIDDLFDSLTAQAQKDGITDWTGASLDVAKVMKPFFYQVGYPVVNLASDPISNTVTLKQSPMINMSSYSIPSEYGYTWSIPLTCRNNNTKQLFWFPANSSSISIDLGTTWQVDNFQAQGFFRVQYDDVTWSRIYKQLMEDPSVFDPISRASLMDDAWNLAERGTLDYARLLDMTLYMAKEDHYAAWATLDKIANQLKPLMKSQDEYPKLLKHLATIVGPQQQNISWEMAGTWPATQFSGIINRLACENGAQNCVTQATNLFQEFDTHCQYSQAGTASCSRVAPDNRQTLYCMGLSQDASKFDLVYGFFQWFSNTTYDMIYDNMNLLYGLSCVKDKTYLDRLMTILLDGTYNPCRLNGGNWRSGYNDCMKPLIVLNIAWNDPTGEYLEGYLSAHKKQVYDSAFDFQTYVNAMTTGWDTEEKANNLLRLSLDEGLQESYRQILVSASATVRTRIKWLNTKGAQIKKWLNAHY